MHSFRLFGFTCFVHTYLHSLSSLNGFLFLPFDTYKEKAGTNSSSFFLKVNVPIGVKKAKVNAQNKIKEEERKKLEQELKETQQKLKEAEEKLKG